MKPHKSADGIRVNRAEKEKYERRRHTFYERYGPVAALFLISASTLIVYSKTLNFPFHFDDYPYIVWNVFIRDLKNFWPPWGLRRLGFLSFALNYRFWGLDVGAFRLTNIIIHILNAGLVFLLLSLTMKTPVMRRMKDWKISPRLVFSISLAASLIFALHPVHTQAVTYITQRFASLATLLYLSGLVLFIKWRLSRSGPRNLLYVLSLFLVFLAQTAKEIAFTLPFVIILLEFYFFENKGGLKKRLLFLAPYLLALSIVPLLIFGPEAGLLPERAATGSSLRELQIRDLTTLSPCQYLITQFRVIVTYLRLLVLPLNQSLDYGYRPFDSILAPEVFLSLLFLIFLAGGAIYLFRRAGRKGEPLLLLASFDIFWFFITLSVESSAIPIKDVINEHRLYLPSIGMITSFVSLFFYAFKKIREGKNLKVSPVPAAVILLLFTALPLGFAAYKRNMVWRDYISLYEDIVKKNPKNARGHNNLGNSYYHAGRVQEAIREFRISASLAPATPNPYYNLGRVYLDIGRSEEAENLFRRVLEIRPDDPRTLYKLGETYQRMGRLDEAIENFNRALKVSPVLTDARKRLGEVYERKGLFDNALKEYLKVLELEPQDTALRLRLAGLYKRVGRIEDAVEEYNIVLALEPANPGAHLNLGDLYRKRDMRERALFHYKKFLKVAPPEYGWERLRVIGLLKNF